MASADAAFAGAIPAIYDRHFGTGLFGPHGERLAGTLQHLKQGAVLEVAAGTGIVTAILARNLPEAVEITATDLNQGMLDFAAGKPGLKRATLQQADAMALPFPDGSFDAVACQFGVMFFPERVRAHAEAWRVLKPGGRYVFNVWGPLSANPAAEVIEQRLAELFPKQPPRFLSRTPFGYHDRGMIAADLKAGGFTNCNIELVASSWQASSVRDPAMGFCQGSPLRGEIERADPDGLARATDAAEAALAARFGRDARAFPTHALLVETRK